MRVQSIYYECFPFFRAEWILRSLEDDSLR